jgi:hypothetical protein
MASLQKYIILTIVRLKLLCPNKTANNCIEFLFEYMYVWLSRIISILVGQILCLEVEVSKWKLV